MVAARAGTGPYGAWRLEFCYGLLVPHRSHRGKVETIAKQQRFPPSLVRDLWSPLHYFRTKCGSHNEVASELTLPCMLKRFRSGAISRKRTMYWTLSPRIALSGIDRNDASSGSWTTVAPWCCCISQRPAAPSSSKPVYSLAVGRRRRPEHHIDAGPLQVFLRSMAQLGKPILENEMVIRRGDIDPVHLDRHAVLGIHSSERPRIVEQARKDPVAARIQMHRHEDSPSEILGNSRHKHLQRLKTACRGAHHDNVSDWHHG